MSAADKTKLDGIASGANNYSLPASTSTVRGGVKIGYSANGKNYPVQLSNEQMFVNVPWTDTNTTYSAATQTANGLMSAADKKKLDGIAAGAQVNVTQTTITGNAGTATKLQTARTISLTGQVTGSTSFDGSANASIATSIDFSTMPTDKFETMLKQLKLPIWLTANKNFYVATTGSDVLDNGRGESASKPFKTVQACFDYISSTYNLSKFNAIINIANGDYTNSSDIVLSDYTSQIGTIQLVGANRDQVKLPGIVVSAAGKTIVLKSLTICSHKTDNVNGQTLNIANATCQVYNVCIDHSTMTTFTGMYELIEVGTNGILEISASYENVINLYFKSSTTAQRPSYVFEIKDGGKIRVFANIIFLTNFTFAEFLHATNGSWYVGYQSWVTYPTASPQILKNSSNLTITGKKYSLIWLSSISCSGGPNWFLGSIDGTVDNMSSFG